LSAIYSLSQSAVKILQVNIYVFFVSIEEILDPFLKEKPLIVGGSIEGRGVVSAAYYSARKYGIHSVMPTARANYLCFHANFLLGLHRFYSKYSAKVFEILRRYSSLFETMLLDEVLVDLTGCGRLNGSILKTAEPIRNEMLD
jgi:DNA polymerase IV